MEYYDRLDRALCPVLVLCPRIRVSGSLVIGKAGELKVNKGTKFSGYHDENRHGPITPMIRLRDLCQTPVRYCNNGKCGA